MIKIIEEDLNFPNSKLDLNSGENVPNFEAIFIKLTGLEFDYRETDPRHQ